MGSLTRKSMSIKHKPDPAGSVVTHIYKTRVHGNYDKTRVSNHPISSEIFSFAHAPKLRFRSPELKFLLLKLKFLTLFLHTSLSSCILILSLVLTDWSVTVLEN